MRDHKSLMAWQVAHEVVRAVQRVCRFGWKPHVAAVLQQLQRSSLSVQLNIAEGYALGHHGRFSYHLRIAYGSAVETEELLELLLAEEVASRDDLEVMMASCRRTQRLLLGLLHRYESLKRRPSP